MGLDGTQAALDRMAGLRAALGPGLLWAAAAIGVSHLVQSTRAGADGGFSLVWVVLAALAVKYPFFEYGPRYAAATGESLVEGYLRIGRWAVWAYLILTLASALIIQVAVTMFTSFLLAHALGVDWPLAIVGSLVIAGCAVLLWLGRFEALDRMIKALLVLLVVCTVFATSTTLSRLPDATFVPWPLAETPAIHWVFILALVGWMPSAIDVAVWSSLWTLANDKSKGIRSTVRAALLDFRIGYVGTGIIALAFLTLGATVMHTNGQRFSPEGGAFSLQLVDLYSATLGEWSRPIILVAALTTMLSTTLTVMDGFPRAIARSVSTLRRGLSDSPGRDDMDKWYWLFLLVLGAGTIVVLHRFVASLTSMIDFATLLAFVTAPALGFLNLRAVTLPHVPAACQPGPRLRAFSYLGLGLMTAVAIFFMVSLATT